MIGVHLLVVAAAMLLAFGVAVLFGLKIKRDDGDPMLVERVMRYRGHTAGFAMFLAIVVSPLPLSWFEPLGPKIVGKLVLLLVGCPLAAALGRLPAMRRLHGDDGPWLASAMATVRYFVAMGGFLILTAILPYAIAFSGDEVWIVGILASLGMIAYSRYGTAVFRRVLAMELFEDEGLRRLDANASCPRPWLGRFGVARGGLANAFALYDPRRPLVAFTRRLLAEVEPEELAAIYAHELAHLEEPEVPRQRRVQRVMLGAALVASLGVPVTRAIDPSVESVFLWTWVVVLFVVLFFLGRGNQHHESHCDARAVELGADPEAMIRGLVALHRANLVPRRIAATAESKATHPSLARRIRDLETLAGKEPEPFEGLQVADDRDPTRAARIGAEAIEWRSGPSTETLAYDDLRELRVLMRGRRMWLRVETAGGERRQLRIANSEVAAVQEALDRVDTRIAFVAGGNPVGAVTVGALVASLALYPGVGVGIVEFGSFLWVMGLVLCGALTRVAEFLAACGAAVVLVAAFPFFASQHWWASGYTIALILAASAGSVVVWRAWAVRREARRSRLVRSAALIGLAFVGAKFAVTAQFGLANACCLCARYAPYMFLIAVAAGTGLALRGPPSIRAVGLAAGLFGLAQCVFVSPEFHALVLDEPLVVREPIAIVDGPAFDVAAAIDRDLRFYQVAGIREDGEALVYDFLVQTDETRGWTFERVALHRDGTKWSVEDETGFYDTSQPIPSERMFVETLPDRWAGGWFDVPAPHALQLRSEDGVTELARSIHPIELRIGEASALAIVTDEDGASLTAVDRHSGTLDRVARVGRVFARASDYERAVFVVAGAIYLYDFEQRSVSRCAVDFETDYGARVQSAGEWVVVVTVEDGMVTVRWLRAG